jgi:hypothetical protein
MKVRIAIGKLPQFLARCLIPLPAVSVLGCGAPDRESGAGVAEVPTPGMLEQSLGETSCATAAPTRVLTGGASYQSPITYSAPGCFKAVVVDVPDITFNDTVTARMTSASAPDEATCERLWLGSNFYVSFGEGFEKFGFASDRGLWAFGACLLPSVTFELNAIALGLNRDEVEAMDGIRITASARVERTQAARTRPLEVSYLAGAP